MSHNETEETSQILTVEAADVGTRLDAFLSVNCEGWSRSRLQKLIDEGDVSVNGKPSKSSYKLRIGDEVEYELIDTPVADFQPENIPLNIVFEDEFLAVINKPAGMVVHPGAGVPSGTLANAVAYHFGLTTKAGDFRVGIVHRLDKDTSGLIVVAKDPEIQEALSAQFRLRTTYKSYMALVHGVVEEEIGKLEKPIGRDRKNRLRMTVVSGGKPAISTWKVREWFDKFTLVDVKIKTGRTHQIRVHLSHVNHPVVGDELYNSGRDKTVKNPEVKAQIAKMNRFFLHSERLAFEHPKTGERMLFEAELPPELDQLVALLKENLGA